MSKSDMPVPEEKSAAGVFARRLMRVVPSLTTQALRMAFLRAQLQANTPVSAASALDVICGLAERGEPTAKEILLPFTGLLQEPELQSWIDVLRRCADERQLEHLASHICHPKPQMRALPSGAIKDHECRVPDYGRGRTLTLGERKSLARRPSRHLFDRLMGDPHPSVIHNLLNNSVTTEDDIVRLAATRPLPREIMSEIAKHPKWNVRRRVRLALVLNPGCPPELGVPLVGLLMKSELKTVCQLTDAQPEIRKAAAERLGRSQK